MNKVIPLRLFLFIGWILLFTMCNAPKKESIFVFHDGEPGFAIITGMVHNRDFYPNTNELVMYVSHISGSQRVSQIRTPLHDDGSFHFSVYLTRPQDASIQSFVDFLYLIPGDSMHIELDFERIGEVRISGGKSADINNEFFRYFAATGYRTIHSNYGVGTTLSMEGAWEDIVDRLNAQRDEFRYRRATFLRGNKVHPEVEFLTEAMIELDYYETLVSIARIRDYFEVEKFDNNILRHKTENIAERFFHSGLYSNSHFSFISSAYIGAAMLSTERPETPDEFVEWTNREVKNETIRNFVFTTSAGSALLSRDLERFRTVAQHITHDHLLDRVMQEYRTTRMNMLNPEFISSYLLGDGRRESFSNLSLQANPLATLVRERGRGNVHVISINAVWCIGCRVSIPLYAELIEEFDNENVTFTFVSATEGESSVQMYTNNGIPLSLVHFATTEEMNFFMGTFAPFGFPYGILVNRNGVIVDFGGHVRPEMRLRENIELLLKQDNLIRW